MLKGLSRKLVATTVLVVVGLAPSLVTPAHAATGRQTTTVVALPSETVTEVSAGSVNEARAAVSNVLAANNASNEWPRVDADLTPKLDAAAAAGGGEVSTEILGLKIKIVIKCKITFPPLHIKCTIKIIIRF